MRGKVTQGDKEAKREYDKARYKRFKEQLLTESKARYAALKKNPMFMEKNRVKGREWYKRHKTDPNFYAKRKPSAEGRLARSEKAREKRKRHFFIYAAKRLNTRAKIKTNISALCLWGLWKKQRGRCALSGRILSQQNAEIDHIVPLSRGGGNGVDNIRWLSADINRAKGASLDSEFFEMCREVLSRLKKEAPCAGL